MTELLATWQERHADWWMALLQHLQLSLTALLLAIFIALPLGIFIQRRRRSAEMVLQIAGL